MDFDVYCDESRPDAFTSRGKPSQYMVLGSLWMPTDSRKSFKEELHEIRKTHSIGGEAKWQKISASKLSFYTDLIDWFLEKDSGLRFRCIVVDSAKTDIEAYHKNDSELAFYKFYYQLLHHWILDFNTYTVFCDFKSNRSRDRLPTLQSTLNDTNLFSEVKSVQAVRSAESVFIQFADILTGAASAKLNKSPAEDGPKSRLIDYLENRLGREIRHTSAAEQKFNVFVINFRGGW